MASKKIEMTAERYASLADEYFGICLACGSEQEGCEPDARRYACEDCGKKQVYGVEELLMLGRIHIVDGSTAPHGWECIEGDN